MLKNSVPVVLPVDPLLFVVTAVRAFVFAEAVAESVLVGSLVVGSVGPSLLAVSVRELALPLSLIL